MGRHLDWHHDAGGMPLTFESQTSFGQAMPSLIITLIAAALVLVNAFGVPHPL